MKQGLTFLAFLLIFVKGYSQITIDQNDMPNEGDTLRMSITNILPSDYTKTGKDTTWDFSALLKTGQQVDTFVNVLNVPPVYWFIFTPVVISNLAAPGSFPIPVPGITISSFFNFYKNSAASFGYLGFAFQVSGLPIMMKYDNPDLFYSFPVTNGSSWHSQSSSSALLPGMGFYSTIRNRTTVVDGWGTLITPYGTFQTLRIKSQWTENDSIFIDSLGMGIPFTRNVTEYKWLAKNQGAPLLQITEEGPSRTAVYRDIINHTGITELQEEKMSVSPNPADGSFVIRLKTADRDAMLVIFGQDGKIVSEEPLRFSSGESNVINCHQLSPGIYFLKVLDKKGVFTGKLVIKQ